MQKTLKNLTKAFIGESQARNRYTYYAKIAQSEGYEQIAAILVETADQEKTHAKRIFEHIQVLKNKLKITNPIMVEADSPSVYGNTAANLTAAIGGEHHEYASMYPEFAQVAEEEGLPEIANRLRSIAIAEKHHEERYKKLLKQLETKSFFKKDKEVWWVCRECGYMHKGQVPPVVCPACNHAQAYYQVQQENY